MAPDSQPTPCVMREEAHETGLGYPTVVSFVAEGDTGEVIIDDGWGVRWALIYIGGTEADSFEYTYLSGGVVPRGERDCASRMVIEPPEDIIALGRSALENAP